MATEFEGKASDLAHSKTFWIVGGLAGVASIWYFRKKATASAATTTPQTDPNATDPNATNYGDGSALDYGYSPVDQTYGGATAGYYQPSGSYVNTIQNNEQWGTAAEQNLVAAGYNAAAAAVAIGKYLTGAEPVTADQEGMIQAAIALTGPTPTQVPPVTVLPSSSTSAKQISAPVLKVSSVNKSKKSAVLSWSKPANAYEFHVYKSGSLETITLATSATVHSAGSYHVVAMPITVGATVGKYSASAPSNSVTVNF